jgi:PTS system ascorbate-specific IIA component
VNAAASPLSTLLPASGIRIGATAADWRGAIVAAGEALVASGATTQAYTGEMIATVEGLGPYIVIAPGIALAHSRPSPAVLHAGISLVTLAQPVEFGHKQNDPVSLVVGLAAPDEEGHVQALATLAEFLSEDSRRDALLSATTPGRIVELIRAFERDQAAGSSKGVVQAGESEASG